jgi:hypothetical protein
VRQKLLFTFELFILNLFAAYEADPAKQLGIPLASKEFRKLDTGWNLNPALTYKTYKRVFDWLSDEKYLIVRKKGYRNPSTNKGYNTKIQAGPQFIDEIVKTGLLNIVDLAVHQKPGEIIFRDEFRKKTKPPNDPILRQLEINLNKINAHIADWWIDLCLSDKDRKALNEQLRNEMPKQGEDPRPAIDLSGRTLHRVFNQSSLAYGGRFYGGFWQNIPRNFRGHLTLNGAPTVELDFSGLHPNMLYAILNLRSQKDPYIVPGYEQVDRKFFKNIFNKLLNGSDLLVRQEPSYDPKAVSIPWDTLVQAFFKRHEPIKKFFGTGIGLRLQRLDSDLAEHIMLKGRVPPSGVGAVGK